VQQRVWRAWGIFTSACMLSWVLRWMSSVSATLQAQPSPLARHVCRPQRHAHVHSTACVHQARSTLQASSAAAFLQVPLRQPEYDMRLATPGLHPCHQSHVWGEKTPSQLLDLPSPTKHIETLQHSKDPGLPTHRIKQPRLPANLHPLCTQVLANLKASKLLPPGERVLVAVSGSPVSYLLLA